MSRSVVLLSGGMDSAVAALLEAKQGRAVLPLFVDYGQRHRKREGDAAWRLCRRFDWTWRELRLPRIDGSSLTSEGELTGSSVVVPCRNLILCAVAANHAEVWDAERVVIGCNANDHALFRDCRPDFYDQLNVTLQLGGSPVRVEAPLAEWSKARIVQEGNRLGVPWQLTWSCYAGGPEPCGECGACQEREGAFRE